jgi:hypothetical protein
VKRFKCAWPYRLEQFVNQLFGGELIKVHVVGMGGTNSAMAASILEYELLPKEMKTPDILISSYATNDMHVLNVQNSIELNVTLRDLVFDITQTFLRLAWKPNACRKGPRPLFLHLDDYLGNEQNEIWSTTTLSQAVQVLANYYGFPSMSYPDMVRDLVYANTRETVFSPQGWYKKNGAYGREIHPGATGHITMAWMTAYNFLNLGTLFCSTQRMVEQTLALGGNEKFPHAPWRGVPPPLTRNLSLEHVSALWEAATIEEKRAQLTISECRDRCVFSWVSGIDLLQSDVSYAKAIFADHIVESDGWALTEFQRKMGFTPDDKGRNGSALVLGFENLVQPIHSVTIFYMRSFGVKWEGSLAKVHVMSNVGKEWRELATKEMSGFHEKGNSQTYAHTIPLIQAVAAGASLRIRIAMVGGSTFKVMGLAVCS